MRFRQMATYRGVPYEVGVGPSESDVVLFAACPPPEELGFEPAPGHWRKRVIRAEVDVLWESRPIGTFHGEACLVLDDLGDRLHIVYLGKDARRARELGYWQVDRGVFELLTPRDEVTSLTEEKVEKNLSRSRPEPTAPPQPSYPYGAQPWPAAPPAAPAPAGARGRGYPEPAMAPAGAWTGNGAPPQWNGNGTGGHPAPGYGGQPGWAGPGTGPQPPVTSPQPPVTGPQPPVTGPQPPVTGPQPPVSGYGAPAGWTGNGAPGGTGSWTGSGTGGHPAPHWNGNGTPAPPGGWNGHGAPPPAGWSGNGAPPPGWTGPGTGPQPPVGGYGPPATWTGNGAPGGTGSWAGNGAAGMNGHGPVNGNGNGTGQWNGAATMMQAPPAGPNGILEGTPLAGPPRRAQAPARGRSARKQRVQTRSIFSELADLAAIPRSAYALEQEADGAMCLLRTDEGFEVFSAADGARHEVRTFEDEEAAYFYLFGVLAAEAVRNGSLIPPR